MKIDQAIIDEYLLREKNGWDTEQSEFFVSIVNSIKARHPRHKLSKLVEYYVNYNQEPQNKKDDWYGRIYTNPNSHRVKKVYNDRKELIEFLLFFGFYNNIDSILNRFGYDELYIFNKDEWAAKTAIKLKDMCPDKTPYVLYKELLSDPEIQSTLTDSNIDYNQALCLTSRAMPDWNKIDSIESARNFVYQYKNDFGRVRVTRYAVIQSLFDKKWQLKATQNAIANEGSAVLEDGVNVITEGLMQSVTFDFLFDLNAKIAKDIVINSISTKIQNEIKDKKDDENIFDYVLRKNFDKKTSYVYVFCLAYAQVITGHYNTEDEVYIDIRKLSDEFKNRHSDGCLKCLKGQIVEGKGKNIQNTIRKEFFEIIFKNKLKESVLFTIDDYDVSIANVDNLDFNNISQIVKQQHSKIEYVDLIKEINLEHSLSKDKVLLLIALSLSADLLESYVDDRNDINNDNMSSKIILDINELLSFCGFSNIDENGSKFEFLISMAINKLPYKTICKTIYQKRGTIFIEEKKKYEIELKETYPIMEYIWYIFTQAQKQTQAEEVSH